LSGTHILGEPVREQAYLCMLKLDYRMERFLFAVLFSASLFCVREVGFFALQESSFCKAKTLRGDATDAQMKMQAELARISAQRAQSALCFSDRQKRRAYVTDQ
jgi:hypothetical protein